MSNQLSRQTLYRNRRTNWPARLSLGLLTLLILCAWASGDFGSGLQFGSTQQANLQRFLSELRPYPLQGKPFDWAIYWTWATNLMQSKGWQAVATTLAIAVSAISLASIGAMLVAVAAVRTLANRHPYRIGHSGTGWLWLGMRNLVRFILSIIRAIPEYVWAFLLLALLGPTLWVIVLALALHNVGILGRLSADLAEDIEPAIARGLAGLGASRLQLFVFAALPQLLPRLLVLTLYRWETCIREATVLGMLGIASLGFWIQDARARNFYDEMLFLVLLGTGLILLGELLGLVVRRFLR